MLRNCYRAGATEVHCDFLIVMPNSQSHEQQLSTDQLCFNNFRLMQADWQTESTAHDSLEIVHSSQ